MNCLIRLKRLVETLVVENQLLSIGRKKMKMNLAESWSEIILI